MSTSSEGSSKIIPSDDSSNFRSWELPDVGNKQLENGGIEEVIPMLTADELEAIHQQAYSEGYEEGKLTGIKEGFEEGEEEGKKQGHQDAYDETSKSIQEQLSYFQQINQLLQKPLLQINDQVEYELIQLVFSIARQIIKEEIKASPEHVVSLFKESLNLLPSASKSIKVYLNPLDISLIKEAISVSDDKRFDDLQIIEHTDMQRGGCIVDTSISHIDASIEKQIDLLAKKMIPKAPPKAPDLNNKLNNKPDIPKVDSPEADSPATDTPEADIPIADTPKTDVAEESAENSTSENNQTVNESMDNNPQEQVIQNLNNDDDS